MLKVGLTVIALLAGQCAAHAQWFARCTGVNNSCHGEACGATPDDARARCLQQCPGSDTHSVGTSSCTVPKTQTQSQPPQPPQATPRADNLRPGPLPSN
jgi:hypothetical protein